MCEGIALGAAVDKVIQRLMLCINPHCCLFAPRQTLKRTGWVNNKVALPESVADHMYRMGMCCMLLDDANETVNRSKYVVARRRPIVGAPREAEDIMTCMVRMNRCIKMAIVHDLAESLVGDITPHDGRVFCWAASCEA
jgi:hypothetical protein